jgi:large subunit ribosomal protein L23
MSPAAATKTVAKKAVAKKKAAAPAVTTGPTASKRERLMGVLIAPHVTEKTSLAMQNGNQYAFKVRRDADKPEIKAAVELMFDVKVSGVQVVNEPGKERRFGKTPGRTQNWKKAYVRLAAGQAIDYEAKPKA